MRLGGKREQRQEVSDFLPLEYVSEIENWNAGRLQPGRDLLQIGVAAAEDRLIPVVAPLRAVVIDGCGEPGNFTLAIVRHVEADRDLSGPALGFKVVVAMASDLHLVGI